VKKPGLTLDEHTALAAELYTIHHQVQTLMVDASHKYPKNSALVRHLAAAGKQLSRARSEGDERLAVEHPVAFDPKVYYPGPVVNAVTFPMWLAELVSEQSPVGDLARDAAADDQFPGGESDERATYEAYLTQARASEPALEAFSDAWNRYTRTSS
jgi:hypothetical protein